MSRRDTIIIALLVNSGLLALLFMLAINPASEEVITDHPEIAKTLAEARSSAGSVPASDHIILLDTTAADEVDTFIKDLASENAPQTFIVDEEGYLSVQPEKKSSVTDSQAAKKETPASDDLDYVNVTVKRGDALEKIARNNGTTVEAIKKANQLSTAKLSIGQVLRVPVSAQSEKNPPKQTAIAASSLKEPEKKSPAASEAQYYTVKSGDNPWKIAKQFNVKFEELLRLNNLDEERARNLKIGDKVRVK